MRPSTMARSSSGLAAGAAPAHAMRASERLPAAVACVCLRGLLVLMALGWMSASAGSGGSFIVREASTRLVDGLYLLDADLELRFAPAAEPPRALLNGVPLTIQVEIEIRRSGFWPLRRLIATLKQRYRVVHHAISGQYVVINLNSDELNAYPSLNAALTEIGRIHGLPVLDATLVAGKPNVWGRLRVGIALEELPLLLRPVAYLSGEWRIESDWHRWPL